MGELGGAVCCVGVGDDDCISFGVYSIPLDRSHMMAAMMIRVYMHGSMMRMGVRGMGISPFMMMFGLVLCKNVSWQRKTRRLCVFFFEIKQQLLVHYSLSEKFSHLDRDIVIINGVK